MQHVFEMIEFQMVFDFNFSTNFHTCNHSQSIRTNKILRLPRLWISFKNMKSSLFLFLKMASVIWGTKYWRQFGAAISVMSQTLKIIQHVWKMTIWWRFWHNFQWLYFAFQLDFVCFMSFGTKCQATGMIINEMQLFFGIPEWFPCHELGFENFYSLNF